MSNTNTTRSADLLERIIVTQRSIHEAKQNPGRVTYDEYQALQAELNELYVELDDQEGEEA